MVNSFATQNESANLEKNRKIKRFLYQKNSNFINAWTIFHNLEEKNNQLDNIAKNCFPINTKPKSENEFNLETVRNVKSNDLVQQPNKSDADKSNNHSSNKSTSIQGDLSLDCQKKSSEFQNATTDNVGSHNEEKSNLKNSSDNFNDKKPEADHVPAEKSEKGFSSERADKLLDAYLKSRGMGVYTTSSKSYEKNDGFGWS